MCCLFQRFKHKWAEINLYKNSLGEIRYDKTYQIKWDKINNSRAPKTVFLNVSKYSIKTNISGQDLDLKCVYFELRDQRQRRLTKEVNKFAHKSVLL